MQKGYVGGAKTMINGGILLLPTASPAGAHQRLEGENGSFLLSQGRRGGSEIDDLTTMERFKELRARLEPLLKPKTFVASFPVCSSTPSSPEECAAPALHLPQWGLCKRARRSRFDVSKLNGSSFPVRAFPFRYSEDPANGSMHARPVPVPARTESEGPNVPEAVAIATRDGGVSKTPSNLCAPPRHRTLIGNGSSSLAPSRKDDSSHTGRQRNDASVEPFISNRQVLRHSSGVTHFSRATATSEVAAASAFMQSNPRSEIETLEWPRIFLGLSRKEKEDDFLIFKGTKLPQRPKRRPKVAERALHFCTPGNALCDLSRGRYDVREKKSVKKTYPGRQAIIGAIC
ncbi:hypothetical protein KP509_05G060000 [Ceratopteris richardii]|uniref:Uncharacterized protein n=1 Tax=Ceratopteris richardii TaxID=49495 RepID=A0A8T2UTT6_CERRI|nr:hypothetical protein KP509_05G060000 [Ceratopteris richardii]